MNASHSADCRHVRNAIFVVLFMLVAAPLASYIPLAGLAGRSGHRLLDDGRQARVLDADPLLAGAMRWCCLLPSA